MSGLVDIAGIIKDKAVEEALANAPVSGAPWSYVTGLDPLAVRLDGANLTPSGPVPNDPIYPDAIVSGLRVGDRVQVLLAGNRATIIGINAGGDSGWVEIPLLPGFVKATADEPPVVRVRGGEVRFQGVVSPQGGGSFPTGSVFFISQALPDWVPMPTPNDAWGYAAGVNGASGSQVRLSRSTRQLALRTTTVTSSSYFSLQNLSYWYD